MDWTKKERERIQQMIEMIDIFSRLYWDCCKAAAEEIVKQREAWGRLRSDPHEQS